MVALVGYRVSYSVIVKPTFLKNPIVNDEQSCSWGPSSVTCMPLPTPEILCDPTCCTQIYIAVYIYYIWSCVVKNFY